MEQATFVLKTRGFDFVRVANNNFEHKPFDKEYKDYYCPIKFSENGELTWIGKLPIMPWNIKSGDYFVYALLHKEEVIYIGQTKKLRGRLMQHYRKFETLGITGLEFSASKREDSASVLESEKLLIQHFQPRFNVMWNEKK